MKKGEIKGIAWIALALIAVALIISGTLIVLNSKNILEKKTLDSNGNSKIEVSANKVSIIIGYDSRNKDAAAAQEDNKLVSEQIINSLKNAGVKDSEIETLSYYVNPEYDWSNGKQTLKDYLATHTLKISTLDLDKIGSYIDAAISGGANRVDSISYELTTEKQNELKAQALKEAAENARTKAEAIAAGSGTKIKKLVSVQDTSYDYRAWDYPVMYAKAEGATSSDINIPTQVETGKIVIEASVRAVFEIQ